MNKQTTTLAGVAAIVVIIAAAVLLGVLPQQRAASQARTDEAGLTQTNSLLNVQLASLAQQSKDRDGLDAELDELRSQIPGTADLASVTRVIVNALASPDGSAGATLVSITPQVPPVAFTPREQLTRDVGEPEVPQTLVAETTEPLPAGTFQEIPLTITATAVDVPAAFLFVDRLNTGPRLLAVHHVQIVREESGSDSAGTVKVVVVGAAYLQPGAQPATAGSAG
ncbi:MAG: hypothetical protein ACI379_15195 [Nocardioides sp.]|uniref:hypothetical protein n=1 Tax=Nocardioides sp. TaxID=35761 RepID=UPI003F087D32